MLSVTSIESSVSTYQLFNIYYHNIPISYKTYFNVPEEECLKNEGDHNSHDHHSKQVKAHKI